MTKKAIEVKGIKGLDREELKNAKAGAVPVCGVYAEDGEGNWLLGVCNNSYTITRAAQADGIIIVADNFTEIVR